MAPRRLAAGRVAGPTGASRIALVAVSPGYLETIDVRLEAGRWLRADDAVGDVCVLDATVASVVFPDVRSPDVVGRTVRLEGPAGTERRRVVGVLSDPLTHRALVDDFDEGQGARALTSALLSFRNVYVPETALGAGEYSGLSVVAVREADVEEVARRLRDRWPDGTEDGQYLPRHSVGVFVRREWMDLIGASSQTGAFLSNIVWMIIVGVAVVMISTLHLLGIRERYGELAIRRVEGARKGDVGLQVTVEGTVLALAGGLAGLPLGYVGAAVLRDIVDFPFRFEFGYALLATGVSVLLGLLAAALPARHAAALDPVKVLTRRPT